MSLKETENTEIKKSASKATSVSGKAQKCDRRCAHQGERICYNDEENKETLKQIPEDADHTESTESLEIDSLHSGESLFKTFSFDMQENDPDMEKCMTFWKDILAKNVKPIKCSLLKNKKTKEVPPEVKPKTKSKVPCDDEETRKMWLDIYKDLQRRKLDKFKLVKTKKCDPCAEYIDEDELKKQETDDIRKLNDWKGQQKGTKLDVESQIQRTLQVLKGARASETERSKSGDQKVLQTFKSLTEPQMQPSKELPDEKIKSESEIMSKTSPQRSSGSRGSLPLQQGDVPTKPRVFRESRGNICCNCGCTVDECICEQLEDFVDALKSSTLELKKLNEPENCVPCECGSICVCDDTQKESEKLCKCGCRVEECICDNLDKCVCGCGVEDCICDQLETKNKVCTCGCGLEECICEQLFTKKCRCGHADCTCDMIEILTTYLETLDTSPAIKARLEQDDLKFVTEGSQTEEKTWLLETTQKKGSYCVICGHFNCYCKTDTNTINK